MTEKTILLGGRKISFEYEKKQVKHINIRVRADGTVHVSAPFSVKYASVEKFMRDNTDFILRSVDRFTSGNTYTDKRKKTAGDMSGDGEGADETVLFFGKTLRIRKITDPDIKRPSARFGADMSGNMPTEIIYSIKEKEKEETENDAYNRAEAVEKLLRNAFVTVMHGLCLEYYPYFKDVCPEPPVLKFRDMVSRWGSCNYEKNIITFNYRLMNYPLDFARYVAVHELTHFRNHDHSKAFYESLSAVLPDYKELKKLAE